MLRISRMFRESVNAPGAAACLQRSLDGFWFLLLKQPESAAWDNSAAKQLLFVHFCLMRILRLLALGFMVQSLAAQNGVLGWQVKNGYRQADNQYYWKNRVPTPGYWQQDVHYKIRARLDDTAERIDGRMELVRHVASTQVHCPEPLQAA